MDAISPSIVSAALASATIAKILVDLVRMTNRLPAWAAPLLALLFGVTSAFLFVLAGGTVLDTRTAAEAVIAGIIAASTAIGSTELQRREKGEPAARPPADAPSIDLPDYDGALLTHEPTSGDHEV